MALSDTWQAQQQLTCCMTEHAKYVINIHDGFPGALHDICFGACDHDAKGAK